MTRWLVVRKPLEAELADSPRFRTIIEPGEEFKITDIVTTERSTVVYFTLGTIEAMIDFPDEAVATIATDTT